MGTQSRITEIEALLAERDLALIDFCDLALVSEFQWCRWRHGDSTPLASTWKRVERALADVTGRETIV